MKIIQTTFEELEKYRKGSVYNKISEFYDEVINLLPANLKEEVKYRLLLLDYYTNPIPIPDFTIPFSFSAKDASDDLKKYLENFVILVKW